MATPPLKRRHHAGGRKLIDGDLRDSINVTHALADAALPKAGGTLTGDITLGGNDLLGVGLVTFTAGPQDLAGTGTPEAAVAAPVGSTFRRSDGSTGTSFYVKETGAATNTGWVAK